MLKRYEGNPILRPIKEHDWEAMCVFNAAVYYQDGVHIIYRGMGLDKVSKLGYAFSKDGYRIDKRLTQPIYQPVDEKEKRGCEDPRLTRLGDRLYMSYAGFDGKKAHVCLASIKVADFLNNEWNWERYGCILPRLPVSHKDDKNACLFPEKVKGRYVLMHRIPPDIWLSYSDDLKSWDAHKVIARPRPGLWDEAKVGAGGPPIKTKEGWLCIYHGVAWRDEEKKRFGTYRLGMMLLDLEDPEKVLFRSKYPILEPEQEYEEQGYVADVVFTCGTVLIGDELFCYYGGADTVICLAKIKLDELLSLKE